MSILTAGNDDGFAHDPIRYKKDEIRTSDLIPTGEIIGEGWGSRVVEYIKNPSCFVVKKSIWPLVNEYRIGRGLSHENIVKIKALFIKEIPLTFYAIYKLTMDWKWRRERSLWSLIVDKIYGRPLYLYKMVMERVHGKTLNNFFGTNLDSSIIESLLEEAKSSCLYLFDQKTRMQAIHGENIMICEPSHKLMIIDLGHWSVEENPKVRGFALLRGVQRLMFNLVSASVLYHMGRDKALNQFNCAIPNLCSQDACPSKMTEAVVVTSLTESDFVGKSELEIRGILEKYCQEVLEKYRCLNSPL